MTKHSLSGNIGFGVFIVALIAIGIAFGTSSWIVSDRRLTGAKLEKMGLWAHCFRSLPNLREADAPRQYFVGCRWIFDRFTASYDEIRSFLVPYDILAVQIFFTLCLLLCLINFGLISLYTMCCRPEQEKYIQLIHTIGFVALGAGVCGCIAVIIFASRANADGWLPGHINNFFGWSFVVGIIGSILAVIAGILLLVEANIQKKKRKYLKESQTRFQMESKS